MTRIDVELKDGASRELWRAVGDSSGGSLASGCSCAHVQLHALEHGITDVRLTRIACRTGATTRSPEGD